MELSYELGVPLSQVLEWSWDEFCDWQVFLELKDKKSKSKSKVTPKVRRRR